MGGMIVENVNTVTITLDEYFELRNKADANAFLTMHFGQIDAQMQELRTKYEELRWRFEELERKNK